MAQEGPPRSTSEPVITKRSLDTSESGTPTPTRSPPIWQPHHGIVFSPPRVQSPPSSSENQRSFSLAATATDKLAGSEPRGSGLVADGTTGGIGSDPNRALGTSIISKGPTFGEPRAGPTAVKPISNLLASLRVNGRDGSKPDTANKAQEFWTYERYGKANGTTPVVQVCDKLSSADTALEPLFSEPVLGLDLEWVANANSDTDPKRRVSLIQVAGHELIVLVQVARFEGSRPAELMPRNLRKLLENAEIKKVGVNIRNDCGRLRDSLDVLTQGVYELSNLHKLVKYSGVEGGERLIDRRLVSLNAQCEEHLGLPLFKEQDVRSSDWTKELSAEQRLYAGSDAYVALVLFNALDAKRRALDPVPDLPDALVIATAPGPARPVKSPDAARTKAETAPVAAELSDDSESESDEEVDPDEFAGANPDDDYSPSNAAPQNPAGNAVTRRAAAAAANQPLLDAATAFAQATAANLLQERGNAAPRPSVAKLRAYYLWHTCGLEIRATAKLLDIKGQSAAGYVLEAVMSGRLEHEPRRTFDAARMIPAEVLRKRYMWFLERVAKEEEKKEKRNE